AHRRSAAVSPRRLAKTEMMTERPGSGSAGHPRAPVETRGLRSRQMSLITSPPQRAISLSPFSASVRDDHRTGELAVQQRAVGLIDLSEAVTSAQEPVDRQPSTLVKPDETRDVGEMTRRSVDAAPKRLLLRHELDHVDRHLGIHAWQSNRHRSSAASQRLDCLREKRAIADALEREVDALACHL